MPKVRKVDSKNNKQEFIEAMLWQSADKLRKNMDAAEYKHIVLGLIFLKYISDAFEVLHSKLVKGKGVSAGAWGGEAVGASERKTPSLKGVLQRVYARQNRGRAGLGGLIDL